MKSCPWLQGLHRIYVQVRPERRLHLSIGGHAYLLPNTSLVIKCPVKHFPKSYIRWFKDGRPLASSERLGVSRSGSLKVHFLGPEDTGLYKCVAGPASEIFTLQVLGGPTGRGSADGRESFPLISGSLRPSREELMMPSCHSHRSQVDEVLSIAQELNLTAVGVSLLPPGVQGAPREKNMVMF